ncbi:MAG: hypothetical protein GY908_10195 [Flavobacteriales bacterium]|nr:hypothetical protein [Flavobacteriales bacterium]
MRSFNINIFQQKLEDVGLPIALENQDNILYSFLNLRSIIYSFLDYELFDEDGEFLTNKEVRKIQEENSKALFGTIKNMRKTAETLQSNSNWPKVIFFVRYSF